MQKASINGADIAYDVTGDGDPVLLIHGACIADAMRPLGELLDDYRVITYHRRGYGESGGEPPADVTVHAADAQALLTHLEMTPAHVVGHSYGGTTALQLAADAPELLRSLVLLEPALAGQIPSAELVGENLGQILAPFAEGKADEATDRFLTTVLGPQWKAIVTDSLSPAAIAQANSDADDAFASDLASFETWAFGAEEAKAITCPTLVVLGADSDRTTRDSMEGFGLEHGGVNVFGEMAELARSWVSGAELTTVPAVNHSLQMQDSAAIAKVVSSFLAKNRVPA